MGYIKAFIPKYFFFFSVIPIRLKALGICTEGFRVRADFLNAVRWWEGYPICKISLVNLYSELKTLVLIPLKVNNKGRKTNTYKNPTNRNSTSTTHYDKILLF